MSPVFADALGAAAPPDWKGLAWASLPILACTSILALRGLGQVRPLLIALARLVVQILLLGYVLEWIFKNPSPWLALAIGLMMLVVSASTVGSRGVQRSRDAWGLRIEAFFAIAIAVSLTMGVGIRLALSVEPWYSIRTLVPLLGMVLGNSVHGVALAAERLESELRSDRDRVELRLALGADSRQAALPALRAAVRSGLTPTINSMMIAGIVSIPGMATGQILAGAAVVPALRYQILIYLMIIGTVGFSVLIMLRIRLRRFFTPSHQLAGAMISDHF